MIRIIKIYFRVVSKLSATLAGKHAFHLFQVTRKSKLKKREIQFFDKAKHFTVPFHLEDLDCYQLGDASGKVVLLVHGWNSNAGSMGGIATDLVKKGYCVYAFNLPAHGFSKKGKTNMKICRAALLAVLSHINPSKPISIVAHSFGSAVSAFALGSSDIKVDKLVFLTNPNRVKEIFREFSKYIGLSNQGFVRLTDNASNEIGIPVDELSVEKYGSKLTYNELLLIHDYHDKILPYQNSVAVRTNWRNSKMITFHKIGHYRMLWNAEVIESISEFLETKTISISENESITSIAS